MWRQRSTIQVPKLFESERLLNNEVRIDIAKGEFKSILFRIYEIMEQADVVLVEKPAKGVFAKQTAERKDKVMLVPFTGAITITPSSEKPPVGQHVYLCKVKLSKVEYSVFAMAKSSYKEQAPFWWVRTAHDANEANCALATVKASMGQKAKHMGFCIDHSADFTIPLITNTKPIAAGQELVLFQVQQEKKQPTEVFLPAAKKPKKST